jgi:hypothetical protein
MQKDSQIENKLIEQDGNILPFNLFMKTHLPFPLQVLGQGNSQRFVSALQT